MIDLIALMLSLKTYILSFIIILFCIGSDAFAKHTKPIANSIDTPKKRLEVLYRVYKQDPFILLYNMMRNYRVSPLEFLEKLHFLLLRLQPDEDVLFNDDAVREHEMVSEDWSSYMAIREINPLYALLLLKYFERDENKYWVKAHMGTMLRGGKAYKITYKKNKLISNYYVTTFPVYGLGTDSSKIYPLLMTGTKRTAEEENLFMRLIAEDYNVSSVLYKEDKERLGTTPGRRVTCFPLENSGHVDITLHQVLHPNELDTPSYYSIRSYETNSVAVSDLEKATEGFTVSTEKVDTDPYTIAGPDKADPIDKLLFVSYALGGEYNRARVKTAAKELNLPIQAVAYALSVFKRVAVGPIKETKEEKNRVLLEAELYAELAQSKAITENEGLSKGLARAIRNTEINLSTIISRHKSIETRAMALAALMSLDEVNNGERHEQIEKIMRDPEAKTPAMVSVLYAKYIPQYALEIFFDLIRTENKDTALRIDLELRFRHVNDWSEAAQRLLPEFMKALEANPFWDRVSLEARISHSMQDQRICQQMVDEQAVELNNLVPIDFTKKRSRK